MQTCDIHIGDAAECLASLRERSVHCVVTSPPYYGLRDYGVAGQIGLEETPQAYIEKLVSTFREVRRVLRDDGTLWLNLGDSYDGKTLSGIPWRVAFALQADGWVLRSDVIWHKPNPMPESITDRPTKSHEYLFLFATSPRYYYDAEAVREERSEKTIDTYPTVDRANSQGFNRNGTGESGLRLPAPDGRRNRRSVWTIPVGRYKGAHFATFPEKLVEPCVLAGTSEKGCCAACGAPLRRVVERNRVAARPGRENKVDGTGYVTEYKTLGWGRSCGCKCDMDDTVPCTVLDPFAGACTTGVVALKHGRAFVGIELNPEYAQLGAARLEGAA